MSVRLWRRCVAFAIVAQFSIEPAKSGRTYSRATDPPDVSLSRAEFYVYPDFVTSDEARWMRTSLEKSAPKAVFQMREPEVKCAKETVRMIDQSHVRDNLKKPMTYIVDSMQERITQAVEQLRLNTTVFGYKGDHIYQAFSGFFTYLPGGCHRTHADTDDPGRLATAVLSLSESEDDYEGGALNLRDGYPEGFHESETLSARSMAFTNRGETSPFAVTNTVRIPARALVVFLAENLHEVEPVTKGVRHVYLQWFSMRLEHEDPRAKQRRITKMRMMGKQAAKATKAGEL